MLFRSASWHDGRRYSISCSGGCYYRDCTNGHWPCGGVIEDKLAVRTSLNIYEDPGFIDYGYTVREPGVSITDPDWTNLDAVNSNLKNVKDANGETTTTGRISLRYKANESFEGTLNYFYQKQDTEGRSIVHHVRFQKNNRALIDPVG